VKDRRGIAAADRACGLPSALVEDVANHHPRARLDHQPSGFGADTTRRTRDQGDLTVNAVH